MLISELIEQLERQKNEHGDVQVTCTGTGKPDCDHSVPLPNVYETTVENLEVRMEESHPSRSGKLGTRVRVWL
ncbi:hypothetical protein Poly59_30620 [Rubripirellula reticaptiva]|uniref:Uncharacterized protein n=1 Tax=Rubripirellula reticaptiva TaxID=2528013 RepID=A0A5C6ET08_9BACT|nr:hypothetical protein Poly59_30620 [Rubripirellula reticaptiva]